MKIADLHIHSHYSRATSRDLTPEYLDLWARRKGIHLVGTGDFTHPAWREELSEKLEPAQEGLYVLKEEYRIRDGVTPDDFAPRFVITGEISSIYKKNDRVRKVHSLILMPDLARAEILSRRLETIGNVHSDGRPILGLDCHDLLEITLELCPEAVYIPAHIWTPHFSLFGAFSGFDTVEECFGDLTPHIHALETGLSSDPPMNWRLSALDSYQLVSNSDAHSPAKLGREANLLDIDLSYPSLCAALNTGEGLYGTIEFFPEEGKYHYDGHRKCHLCLSPSQALRYRGKCPVCGRKLTVGVSHRVEELADRSDGYVKAGAKPFESLVPLPEVLAASTGRSAASVKVQAQYEEMLRSLGTEFSILREVPVEDIKSAAGRLISEGIRRLRAGEVERSPGFDGEYGTIRLFEPWEIEDMDGQLSLFTGAELAAYESAAVAEQSAEQGTRESTAAAERDTERVSEISVQDALCQSAPGQNALCQSIPDQSILGQNALRQNIPGQNVSDQNTLGRDVSARSSLQKVSLPAKLNPRQQEAVTAAARAIAVVAGPGTGKTKTLVSRILYLLRERKVKPSEITAVTFTNQAAAEMRERLERELGGRRAVNRLRIGTFHSLCYRMLKNQGRQFALADRDLTVTLASMVIREFGLKLSPRQFLQQVSVRKTGVGPGYEPGENLPGKNSSLSEQAFTSYQNLLEQEEALDFDDLLTETLRLLEGEEKKRVRKQNFSYLLVDEFQDVSPLQYRLIRAWNRDGREFFVIGDPDQAIYGFRGSDARCFDRLSGDFPQLVKIRLLQNYRSSEPVLRGALAVISENPGETREMAPLREGGLPIRLVTAGSDLSEGIFVAREINRLIGGIDMLDAQDYPDIPGAAQGPGRHRSFADIAILYRTRRQADLLEKCLRKEGIPYVVSGRDDFLTERTVRGTLCFFGTLCQPEDRLARRLCLRLLWDLPENGISGSVFQAMQEKYRPLFGKTKPQKLLESWMTDLGLEQDRPMEKLRDMAKAYRNMAEFLDSLAFGEEGDLKRCGGKVYTSDAVVLMTLHGSKGLEFPAVIICGVRQGVIPLVTGKMNGDTDGTAREPGTFVTPEHAQAMENWKAGAEHREEPAQEESAQEEPTQEEPVQEERRLFYVGMTRAMEELILVTSARESEFLSALPESLVHREKADRRKNAESGIQMSLFDFMR